MCQNFKFSHCLRKTSPSSATYLKPKNTFKLLLMAPPPSPKEKKGGNRTQNQFKKDQQMIDEWKYSEREDAIDRIRTDQIERNWHFKTLGEVFAPGTGGDMDATVTEQIEFAINYEKQTYGEKPTTLVLGKTFGAKLNAELREARVNNNIEDHEPNVSTFLGLKCTYVPSDTIKFHLGYERLFL